MAGLITNLINLVDEQYEYLNDLVGLAEEKKDVIIKNDIENLQKITQLESTIVGKISKNIKLREAIFKDIATVLNIEYETITLKSLTEILKNPEEIKKIKDISEKIKIVMEDLKEVNERNKVLIENSSEYAEFAINLIRQSKSEDKTFFSSTGEEVKEDVVLFDHKQ
jgi:flagellar biosynthesis/type III secretory pathway chaperone